MVWNFRWRNVSRSADLVLVCRVGLRDTGGYSLAVKEIRVFFFLGWGGFRWRSRSPGRTSA